MLKPYFGRESPSQSVSDDSATLLAALTANEDSVAAPSRSIIMGRLKNSGMLAVLEKQLPHLTDTEKNDMVALIRDFPELTGDVPTVTSVLKHDIDVGTSAPIKQHPYRVNPAKRNLLKKEVDYMLSNNIAEHSSSPWSSPCLLVLKSDESHRFCTDYRRVNAVTIPDSYPLPRMDDCVDRVGSARFVTKLDLLKGYWQVQLTDRAKKISAFVTPDSFLQYKVMAFGMRNAPACFQRLVNIITQGMTECAAYLDDLILYSESWSVHLQQLRELFCRLSKANLTLNLAKCEFGKATVKYLGRVVGNGHVLPVMAKVAAVQGYPVPVNRHELRRFLGMVGYYRDFCVNFSSVVAPLTDILSPKVDYVWSEACQKAFENVKGLLLSTPVLAAPDYNSPFSLAVDASDVGAGAVLLQRGADDLDHPVSYFSKKFSSAQRNYSTIEKETLSLVLALQHFEVYLGGSSHPILVYTDHDPLKFLNRMYNSNQRLMRWSLILQPFCLQIVHVRGKDNVLADALSRCSN